MWKKLIGVGCTSSVIIGTTFIQFDRNNVQKWDSNWDKREPESLLSPKVAKKLNGENEYNEQLKSLKSKAIRHIILIRHGQYNLDGANDEARGLTELGRQQAKETGKRLRDLNFPYRKIVSSTQQRALETTDFILECLWKVPHTHDDLLREGFPIQPEPPFSDWKPDAKILEEGSRIEAAFRRYIHRAPPTQTEDSYDILVCHGNVIRYFVCRALQFGPEGWLRMSVAHCGITWLVVKPNGHVHIRCLGDTGHLQPHAITRT